MAEKSKIAGITIEIGGDTTKLDKALQGVNKQTRDAQKELKEVNKLLKLDPKNTELLAQKQKILAESIDGTKEKLNILKDAEKQVQQQFENGEVSEEQYRALQREIIQTEQQLKNLKKQAEDSNGALDKIGEAAGKIGEKSEALGKKLLPVTAGITAVGTAAVASFNELDEGYDTIITKTGASGEALDGLTESMDNVFGDLPTDAETAGIAIGEVNTRFGATGETLEGLSKQFIEFAEINGTDLNGAIDSVDAIMTKFNVDASETPSVLGLLTKAGQDTGISMDTLQNTLQTNGATLKEMGLDLTGSVNLLAQFESSGVDASTAMAGLKKAQQNATAEGKTLKDALSETIDKIKNAGSETDALQAATELFGKKGAAEMTQAIREGRFSVEDLTGSLDDYKTTVEDTFNATLDPPDKAKVALNNLKIAGADLGETLLNTVTPILEKVVDKVKEFTAWFSSLSDSQKEMIVKIAAVVAAVGPALIIFGKVASGISKICGLASKLGGLLKGAPALMGILSNPVTIVIALIAAAVAAIVLLWNNCEGFRNAVKKILAAITEFFRDAWDKIQEAWAAAQPYFEMIKEGIKTAFSVVVEILTAPFRIAWFLITSIWDIATTYFQNVWIGIQTVFSVVGQIIGGFFESAWIIIKGVWDVVVLYFQTIWLNIQAVFSVVATVLGGFFQVAWTTITTIWDVATGYFQMIWSVIQGIFSVVQSVLSGDFSGAWEAIKGIWSAVTGWFGQVWSGIQNIFGSVGSWFGSIFQSAWNAVQNVFSNWGSFFSGLWGIIRNTFSNLGTSIANAIGGAVKSGINGVISMIENTVNSAIGVINGAINLINKLPGVSVGSVGYVGLPRLAKGGILTNGRAIVAEAGPEIVEMVNGKTIVTPLSGTAKNTALERNFGGQKGSLKQEINMNIENFYNNRKQDVRELTEEVMEMAQELKERDDKVYA